MRPRRARAESSAVRTRGAVLSAECSIRFPGAFLFRVSLVVFAGVGEIAAGLSVGRTETPTSMKGRISKNGDTTLSHTRQVAGHHDGCAAPERTIRRAECRSAGATR